MWPDLFVARRKNRGYQYERRVLGLVCRSLLMNDLMSVFEVLGWFCAFYACVIVIKLGLGDDEDE